MEDFKPWGMEHKTFLLLMHLSQLSSIVIPGAGLVLPIVMWATNKEQSAEIDAHGKTILNWLFSSLIYYVVGFILVFLFIGFLVLPVIALLNLAFVIIAAIKANEGQLWPYPLSIKFFQVTEPQEALEEK